MHSVQCVSLTFAIFSFLFQASTYDDCEAAVREPHCQLWISLLSYYVVCTICFAARWPQHCYCSCFLSTARFALTFVLWFCCGQHVDAGRRVAAALLFSVCFAAERRNTVNWTLHAAGASCCLILFIRGAESDARHLTERLLSVWCELIQSHRACASCFPQMVLSVNILRLPLEMHGIFCLPANKFSR